MIASEWRKRRECGPRAERLARQCGRGASGPQIRFTNREIVDRLFVTVSTAEQHLSRAYRKLNVNQRTDLPPCLKTDQGRARDSASSGRPGTS
jgi:hypothetical protein